MTAASSARVRPLVVNDVELLAELDRSGAARTGVRPALGRASGHFFARSGHSFVVETPLHPAIEAAPVGFLLAHASWSGAHAVVRLERITVEPGPGSAELAGALTAAVVKSAYDAGVYRLVANVAAADRVARDALEATLFESEPRVSYVRQLGSGALDGAGPQATKPVGGGRGEHDRS